MKGSVWTFASQVLPFGVSFFTTPFTIRLLGSEGYGVFILIGLVPIYLAFADIGMGIASTRFGSEAFGRGSAKDEARVVRTAALIALCGSTIVAVPILIFAPEILRELNVAERLIPDGSAALRINAIVLIIGVQNTIVNTPQLSRMRMDLAGLLAAFPKILLAITTPAVLYFGGGLTGAMTVALVFAIVGLGSNVLVSTRLLPDLFESSIDTSVLRPLLKFGAGLVVAGIASLLLMNLDKFAIARLLSTKELAFYSIAFIFAFLLTTFSSSMAQSLIPAFSQLLLPERAAEFESLFDRAVRACLIWVLPGVMLPIIVAKPFITLWAGPEFGEESVVPFYILMMGLIFGVLAYVPYCTLAARNRTDLLARQYWIELVPYGICMAVFISYMGLKGAAVAWSMRCIVDSIILIGISGKVSNLNIRKMLLRPRFIVGAVILSPPVILTFLGYSLSVGLIALSVVCLVGYIFLVWRKFINEDERLWIRSRYLRLVNA
jgi:O-antigen/teichoic acid export membrane protein